MTEPKTRILLIDDHALFRDAVAQALAAEPDFEIAGSCATIAEALEVLRRRPADIVLLDINLGPEQGGMFFARSRSVGFRGKILVVTAGVNDLEVARLLHRGCSGIFLKHEPLETLVERIRAIRKGDHDLDPTSLRAILRHAESEGAGARRPLSPRERDVLRGVFRGLANKEIGNELKVSEALVKAVVQQLFTKTNVRTRSQLVRVALEHYWDQLEDGGAE